MCNSFPYFVIPAQDITNIWLIIQIAIFRMKHTDLLRYLWVFLFDLGFSPYTVNTWNLIGKIMDKRYVYLWEFVDKLQRVKT